MKEPEIVKRNKDIEHIMLASAKYGHNDRGRENYGKLFTMLALTDVHGDEERMKSAIDYLSYYDVFDLGVCLGDIAGSNYYGTDADFYVDSVKRSNKPFLTVLGNHDLGNGCGTDTSVTPTVSAEKFLIPTADKMGEGDVGPYYYREFPDYKISIMVLNVYDAPDTRLPDGSFAVSRTCELISQEQVDFIIKTLKNIPKDYHLIILLHTFFDSEVVVDCPFTQRKEKNHNPIAHAPYGASGLLPDIIGAWTLGGKLKKTYSPIILTEYLPEISVDADFTERGEGIFVCYLAGHLHSDTVAYSEKYNNQNIVYLASMANDLWQNFCSDLPRAIGTKAEDLLTSVSIDTECREVRLVRIGSDMTMDMRERKYYRFKY
jgi:hypothetical protein